jgi:hypothetical protein
VLKGGFALDLRLASRARSTKDVDIEWRAEEDELADTLLDAAEHDAGDFFVLAIERTATPADRLGGAHRFRVSASLAGRPFETFLLDVGLRADDTAGVETLRTDDLLGFAGIEPIRIPAVSLELQIAEKLHAYTQTYEGGRISTRVKDLVDLPLIVELTSLDAATLRQEIDLNFGHRGTHTPPRALPPPPSDWALPFGRPRRRSGSRSKLPQDTGRPRQCSTPSWEERPPKASGTPPSGHGRGKPQRVACERSLVRNQPCPCRTP